MNGYQAIAKILKKEGVEWIAAFPAQPLIDACAREDIRPILSRQERAGVNMADGFSRIKNGNTIGVFTMQTGPGSENAFGGVAQAYADSVPILCLPGGQPAHRTDVHPNFEAVKNYGGITKWMALVNSGGRIAELIAMAFSQLKHGRLGPALLEMPGDVMGQDIPDSLVEDYEPVKPFKSGASSEDVRDLVTALLAADNPVIDAGQGVLYAEATDDLVEFAELTNVPVMTTLAGKSAFPEDHPLALGTAASSGTLMCAQFLQKTDFILGMGSSLTISNFNAPMPSGVTVAHSTNCAEDVNKDYARAVRSDRRRRRSCSDRWSRRPRARSASTDAAMSTASATRSPRIKAQWMEQWSPSLNSDEVPISPLSRFHRADEGR